MVELNRYVTISKPEKIRCTVSFVRTAYRPKVLGKERHFKEPGLFKMELKADSVPKIYLSRIKLARFIRLK